MRFLFPLLGLLLSAIAAAGCAKPPVGSAELAPRIDAYISSLPDGWGAIAVEELNQQVGSRTVVLDVRDAPEVRNEGHITGSINIPVRTLLSNLGKLPDKAQPIVVICSSGHRSALAMGALQLLGYTNVTALTGGLQAWRRAKLPIETGTPPGADRLTSLRAWIGQYIPSSRSSEPGDQLFDALDTYLSNLPHSLDGIPPPMLNDLLRSSKPLQLDVRDAAEVAARGAIPGATNIPLRTLIGELDRLPPDRRALIVAECEDGHRAALAMLALNVLGYGNVRTLMGGLAAWTKAGLPLAA